MAKKIRQLFIMLQPWVGYAAIVAILFAPALFTKDGWMIYGDDIHRQYYFFREFFTTWMRQGIVPWWNPYLFSGEPFMANPVVNMWYAPNWLFFFMPLPLAYVVHIAGHVWWAMSGMKVLLTHVLGNKNRLASWIGGVMFGLSGFFAARTFAGHVDVIAAASYLPWVVWAFIRLMRADWHYRDGVVASVLFALQIFSGYQTMAFFTTIAVGVFVMFFAIRERRVAPLLRAGLFGAAGVGIAAVHILPVSEYFRVSIRTYPLSYTWHAYGSLTWESLVQFLHPFYFGNQHTYAGPPPNFIEHSAFVGVGGIILSLLGAVTLIRKGKRGESSRLFTAGVVCIGVFGIWISLGPSAPIDLQYILWRFIPMYQYLRIPPRHLLLVVFALSALAGVGVSAVSLRVRTLRHGSALLTFFCVAAIFELAVFFRGFIEVKPLPETRHDKELISLLRTDTQPYRMLQDFGVWVSPRDALDFDSVMPYGIFSASGYDPSILRSYYEYIARATGISGEAAMRAFDVQVPYLTPREADTIDTLNIKYLMVPVDYDPFRANTRYVLRRETGQYRLYENTTVQPRFYLERDTCGDAHVTSYTPNRIEIATDTTCGSMLFSSEVYYPGWTANVDSKKVQIGKLYNTFRTLFVPAGKHTVVYQYQPTIFVQGAVISFCTIVLLISAGRRRV